MDYPAHLRRRVARQRAFHERNEPGDLLIYLYGGGGARLEGFLCTQFNENPVERVLDSGNVPGMIETYVAALRESLPAVCEYDDHAIPAALVYWGIGCIAAAQTGLEPFHDGMTSWLEPNLSWEQIDRLQFDPDNKWVRFAVEVNRALWAHWQEDFHVLPYLHRSPLDSANGIRGTVLFEEMYTDPDKVHRLLDWCVDWQLAIETHIAEQAPRPCEGGWGNAVWGTWLPDGGVFVNADPVGLISPEMALEFEQPYTKRFFEGTGGGVYHNHTVGLYQARMVSRTPGTLVQWFVDDPKQPTGLEALLDIPEHQERMLAASLDAPIAITGVTPDRLDEALDIASRGRFILCLAIPRDAPREDITATLRKACRAGNLD